MKETQKSNKRTADIYFVLVRPKFPENIGFTARAIKNFGFSKLVIIAPRCEIFPVAYRTASHAKDVLESAIISRSLDEFVRKEQINYLIGTTARVTFASVKNPKRCAITSNVLRDYPLPSGKIAILFGPEDYGLSAEEIDLCDLTVTIPTSEEYPTMNVSHAVAIIAYELALNLKTYRVLPYRPATREEKQLLIQFAGELVRKVYSSKYPPGKIRILEEIFKHVLSRAFISGREAHSLIGLFKRLLRIVEKCGEKNENT